MNSGLSSDSGRRPLRLKMEDALSLEDLHSVCFDLDIDPDNLPSSTKSGLARELISYFEKRNNMNGLLSLLSAERPDIDWENLYSQDGDASDESDEAPQEDSDTPVMSTREGSSDEVEAGRESGQVDDGIEALPPSVKPSASVLPTSEKQADEITPEEPQFKPLSSLVINIILLTILVFLVTPRFTSAISSQWVFCAPDRITSIGLSIIILLLLHAVWRVLPRELGEEDDSEGIQFLGFSISFRSIKAILDNGHPWVFSDGIFLGGILLIGVAIWLFGLSRSSLTNEQPAAPVLANFEVSVDDGDLEPETLLRGEYLHLQPLQEKTIRAVTDVRKGIKCDWNPEDGAIIENKGCTIDYVAPQNPGKYFLAVNISSACSLQSRDHGLFVEVP